MTTHGNHDQKEMELCRQRGFLPDEGISKIQKFNRILESNISFLIKNSLHNFLTILLIFFLVSKIDAAPIFEEDFSEGVFPPTGWTMVNLGAGGTWQSSGDGQSAYHDYYSASSNSWLITPEIFLMAGKTYTVGFDEIFDAVNHLSYSVGSSFVKISFNGSNPVSFESSPTYEYNYELWGESTIFTKRKVVIGPFEENVNIHLAFQYQATGEVGIPSEWEWHEYFLDNVEISENYTVYLTSSPMTGGYVWQGISVEDDLSGPGLVEYPENATIELIASPKSGYSFNGWIINGQHYEESRVEVLMDKAYIAQAVFSPYNLDLLWRQHSDDINGDYDFSSHTGNLEEYSVQGVTSTNSAYTWYREVADDFINPNISSVSKLSFYFVTDQGSIYTPANKEMFRIRFYNENVTYLNASSGDTWINSFNFVNPLYLDVEGDIYFTGFYANNQKVYRADVQFDEPLIGFESLINGWISIRLRQNFSASLNMFNILRANTSTSTSVCYRIVKGFSAIPSSTPKEFDIMYELWGELTRIEKEWVGGTLTAESDWFNDSNWLPNGVPNAENIVIIPDVINDPSIPFGSIVEVFDLTIESGAELTLSASATLTVHGDMIVDGTFTTGEGSELVFGAAAQQNLSTSTILSVHNLTINCQELVMNNSIEVGDSWTTATETNNSHFMLERAGANGRYETITTLAGAGNSNEVLHYSFTDSSPIRGTSYYRLTQYDFDGRFEVFDPIAVEFNDPALADASLQLYPNPATDRLNIILQSPMDTRAIFELYSISGRLVSQQQTELFQGTNQSVISLNNLPAGIYILRTNSADVVVGPQRIVVE
jgi:hypothetical protein